MSGIFRASTDQKPLQHHPFTVTVEGNMGSGKTTFLQRFLKSSESVEVLIEPVDLWRNVQGKDYNMINGVNDV